MTVILLSVLATSALAGVVWRSFRRASRALVSARQLVAPPRAADIGEPQREVTFEPLPDSQPVPEPVHTPAPAPERQPVPA